MIELIDRVVQRIKLGVDHNRPTAPFDRAIERRQVVLRKLVRDVAGLRTTRDRLAGDIHERRAEIARLHDSVRLAVRCGADNRALALIEQKDARHELLSAAEEELSAVAQDIALAERELHRAEAEVQELIAERRRAEAVVAAEARRVRIQAIAARDTHSESLRRARSEIERMSAHLEVHRELAGPERDPLADDRARLELARLKRQSAA